MHRRGILYASFSAISIILVKEFCLSSEVVISSGYTKESLTVQIIQALDRCTAMPPVAKTPEDAFLAFRHAVHAAGGTMPERFPDERIRALIMARGKSGSHNEN